MKDFNSYRKNFCERAENSGFSSDEILKCLKYSENLFKKQLPIIFNSAHLSALVGYNQKYLRRSVKSNATFYFYRHYDIPKKNGGTRKISEPLPSLKDIQRWLLNNLFNRIPVSPYAKAYTHKRGIRDHVRYHTKEKVVITLDIDSFFSRLNSEMIEKLLVDKGYSLSVANIISKLCTLHNSLPQGAPTSPRISNIILNDFDLQIAAYIKKGRLKYTRYADDIAISGAIDSPQEIIKFVKVELQKLNLPINNDKTKIMYHTERQIISGIVVNEKTQIPRKKRDELKQAMHFIDKFGLEGHLEKINCNKANYLGHLLGTANYILTINPKDEKTKVIYTKLKKLINHV